jgi:two-component system, OmpR family, sensor histidine kinase SenX3
MKLAPAEPAENDRWYLLVLGLAVVLALLAVLQFRSTKQVSDATTEHMRATLQDSLLDLRQGVERELTPLCYQFEGDAGIRQEAALQEYANRLDRWRYSAAHPALVSDLLVWQTAEGDQREVLRLKEGNVLTRVALPAEFAPLRDWLREIRPETLGFAAASSQAAPHSGASKRSAIRAPALWMIDESIPALLHPVLERRKAAHDREPPRITWIILRLDQRVLGREIFPQLAQRNFGRASDASYKLALITNNSRGDVLFSSDGQFGRTGDDASDASLNLFGRPIPLLGAPRAPVEQILAAGALRHPEPSEAATPASHPNLGGDLAGHNDGPVRIDPIHYAPDDPGWTILARHREGSVGAAVMTTYHRNLAINFGVLLVLAITMGLIIATSRRARRLAQAQVDFVAGVSHELRTPLTGIVSAAQNMADGLVDRERTARYGAAILGQAQQLKDLVEQILLFSATQRRAHRYHLQPADVADVVDASLKTTSSLIRSSGFTVQRKIQPRLPQVVVDVPALSQCLQNLIANAIKYSGSSRWIGIEAAVIDANGGQEITLTVEDHGLGISSDELPHIFEPFYRSPQVTSAQIHGSGLGLPLTKSMVEAMGGRLTVQSAPQKGSSFTIHLPVRDVASPPDTAVSPAAAQA